MGKLKIAVLCGGVSSEHEVSVHSAEAVCEILGKKYDVLRVLISKDGQWTLEGKAVLPTEIKCDIFFPVLHGAHGEDGTMQGLFEILDKPYVGCGVLTSAVGMDKELCKLLASFYGVPIVPYIKLEADVKYAVADVQRAAGQLGYPLFVKPNSLGSSVGITRVERAEDLAAAVNKAFTYDKIVLLEKAVPKARELFCAVIGAGQAVHTSLVGELAALKAGFFDYHAKYEDPHGCDMKVPAEVPAEMQDKMREYTSAIFKVLRGDGFARVDFLLGDDGKFYFSEVNMIPGMSLSSLFPQLWAASKKEYADVLDILIHLGLKRYAVGKKLSIER